MVASVQLYWELHLHLHTRRERRDREGVRREREGETERVEEGRRRERGGGKRETERQERALLLLQNSRVRSSLSQPLKVGLPPRRTTVTCSGAGQWCWLCQ